MILRRLLFAFIALLALAAADTQAQLLTGRFFFEAPGDERGYTILPDKTVVATNGFYLRYEETPTNFVELKAQRAKVNIETGEAFAEGSVLFKREGLIWRGDRVEYNFKTHYLKAEGFRTGRSPIYFGGMGLAADGTNHVYAASDVFLTPDDVAEPGFRVHCRTITVVPGDHIEATHATLYAGNVPVLYLPKYRHSLQLNGDHFTFTPGYRSLYGPFLFSTYHWSLSDEFSGRVHMDWREKQGFGIGPDVDYNAGLFGQGEIKFYYARDMEGGTNILGQAFPPNRYRINFFHGAEFDTNLTARVVFRDQRDPVFLHDFFESEFEKNPQPNSFLEINKLWSNFSLNVLTQPRVNNFFETVERLPDVKLTSLRQQIGETPFFYESDSSVGYFRHRFTGNVSNDFAAWRADTFHQITLPETYFGFLNVTPRVGGRFTHYGDTEGSGYNLPAANRTMLNTGAEISLKASRLWPESRNTMLDVDGLRHIIEPSLNYAYIPNPTHSPAMLPQFDSEFTVPPSLRLLPLDFPDYNSIDSIDSENVIRVGVRNVIQTKREGQIDRLVDWSIYTDWRIKPRPDQTTFADIFSDLSFKPRRWLTFTSETRYDIPTGQFNLADHNMVVQPGDVWSFSVGHRYLRGDPLQGTNGIGNNLIRATTHYRLNENWGLRTGHNFEARNGTMQEQSYTLYHDFRSWTGALTTRLRDIGNGQTDFAIVFTFSFKAFPRYHLNHDRDQPFTVFE